MAEERIQRRLAAILEADMVGYSRLIGSDEEGTIARQQSCRAELIDPEIKSHGGRIVTVAMIEAYIDANWRIPGGQLGWSRRDSLS